MQLWHWWWIYIWWLRKKPCQKISTKRETRGQIKSGAMDRESVLAPYTVWMHWTNGSWQSPCQCLDQYSYWCHSSHKCQYRRFSHSWPGATSDIRVFIAWRFLQFYQVADYNILDTKKAMKVKGNDVFDQEAIYARVIGLIVSQRELDLTDVVSCELAAYPPSMFNPDRSMYIATNKTCLKNSLTVETSVWVWGQPPVIVVDVSAVLWTLLWPPKVLSKYLSILSWFGLQTNNSDVHLVLDRYFDYTARSSTRVARASKKIATRVHKLGEKTLPSRDVILKCVSNKIQINHLICKLIMNDEEFLDEAKSHYRLFISGEEAMPTMVYRGRHGAELQLYSTHEESDIKIVKHALWSCETKDTCVVLFPMIQMCLHYSVTTTKGVVPQLK